VRAQSVPDDAFGLSHISTQSTRARADFRSHAPCWSGRWKCPLPTLPRKRGRGSLWLGLGPRQRSIRPRAVFVADARAAICSLPRLRGRAGQGVRGHPLSPPASVGKSSGRKP
jgi:hypothetical protein